MNFNNIESIQKNFCKDKELTREIVVKLEGRDVKVIATDSFIGRLFHKFRYFFSKDYHKNFDAAAEDFLNREVVLRPQTPVPVFHELMPVAKEATFEHFEFKEVASIQKKNPLPRVMDPMFEDIKLKLNPQAEILWRTLFTRFAEDRNYGEGFLDSIRKNSKGTWELTFTEPLKMHLVSREMVDGKEVEDPPGGVVMIFGAKEPLKITIKNGEMHFEGLKTFSKAPPSMALIPGFTKLVGDPVEARFMSFKSLGGDQFEIIGGKETPFKNFTKSSKKPYAKILENWGEKATILAPITEPASVILKK